MKVWITRLGMLSIEAETELEGYALGKWMDENLDFDEKSNCSIPSKTIFFDSSVMKEDADDI